MKIKHNILYYTFCIIIILQSSFFLSCKDDPVTVQPYQFDPPRYNWDIDTLGYKEIYNIWGYDTNCVFYQGRYSIIKYDGNSYHEFYVNGFLNTICGVNENNTYLGGSNANLIPKIWKWNGQFLEEINVPDTTGIYYSLIRGYAISENDIWFGSETGILLNYLNGQFHFYYFDTSYAALPLYLDKNNNFYIFTYKLVSNQHGTETTQYIDIYKKENTDWLKIWAKIYVNEESIVFKKSLNELFGIQEHSVFKFMNNDFSRILKVDQFNMDYEIDGTSENEFIVKGFGLSGHTVEDFGLMHWNGKKWSFEYNTNFAGSSRSIIRNINNRYYSTVFNNFDGTFVLKGTSK